jgi:hypothetical protein
MDGFRAQKFTNTNTGAIVLAFAGTDPKSIQDLLQDITQAAGLGASQYTRAMREGLKIKAVAVDFHFVGHSLGGGLAAAAAMVTNGKATTFNAAGIHRRTLDTFEYTDINGKNHKGVQYNDRNIVAYRVLPRKFGHLAADPLSQLQLAGSVEEKNVPQAGQLDADGKQKMNQAAKGFWDRFKDVTKQAKQNLSVLRNFFDLTGNDGTTVKVQPANSVNHLGIKGHFMTAVIAGIEQRLTELKAQDAT